MEVCASCGSFVEALNSITGFCEPCTKRTLTEWESFLQTNADHIEHYLAQGYSLSRSVDYVRQSSRPRCASCGGVIKRAPRNAIFCRVNPVCRRYSRQYVYMYQSKGYSKAEALAIVLQRING